MKDRTTAALLAFFLGTFGVHRFYLKQTGWGVFYCIFALTGLSTILGLIDGASLLSKSQEDFDLKYNRKYMDVRRRYPHGRDFDRRDRDYRRGYREEVRDDRRRTRDDDRRAREMRERKLREQDEMHRRSHRKQEDVARRRSGRVVRPTANPFRQEGVKKFKDFDYAGAVDDFEKALEINPRDIAVHFNLACCYSLLENKKEAFYHLDKATVYGFKDFTRVREHDALAWLRIQEEFGEFAANNFQLKKDIPDTRQTDEDLLNSQPDLLEQLKKLRTLRDKGFLTEAEYAAQKDKLSR